MVLAIAAIIFALVRRRQGDKAVTQWQPIARAARDDAVLARDLLTGATTERGAPAGAPVNAQVDAATNELDRAAATAPDGTRRDSAAAVAASLRGLQFALEAETLLREGSPTAEQLAQADLTHRTRAQELDQTIARFDEVVRSGEDPKAGSGP